MTQNYGPHENKFTGPIDQVTIEIGQDSHDHLGTAEDEFTISMPRR
ncbi:hypothetical protein [Mycobacterium sp. URHB0021]